jgi:DNA-binding NtrC family response regulator
LHAGVVEPWAPDRDAIAEGSVWQLARLQPRPRRGQWRCAWPIHRRDLVGREQLLGRLSALVGQALDGQRVTVLVGGEAGVGKTSLVQAVTAAAAEQGAQCGWGACVDVDGAPGYWP